MSSSETPVKIARLLTTFNIEIRVLPDKLKCAQCKSVLKDACQVPCGCQFCRTCIDGLIARGSQFCPGGSQECGRTPLSTAAPDYRANKSVLKLTAKCPHAGCTHECPLTDMEGHLRVCSRKSVDCPFRELGCPHGGLAAADMSSHMQQESGSHSEILIGLVAGIKRDMEVLKDDQMRHLENEMKLKFENESMKNEIKSIRNENKTIRDEYKLIQDENEFIREDIKSIKNEDIIIREEIESIKDENKSIREEIESIKNEIRSIKIENESVKVRCNLIGRKYIIGLQREKEVLSTQISAISGAVVLNWDALDTEMKSVINDIKSIKQRIDLINSQMIESMQAAVELGQFDNWLIDEDLDMSAWGLFSINAVKTCDKLRGGGATTHAAPC